jgi:acyl dehydratase
VGDTIRSVSKTVAKRSMKEGGVVVEERSIMNQRGEVVQRGRLTLLVAKRPAA